MAPTLGHVMSTNPSSQRRHAAAQARVATALLSVGGFLGIIGALAASRTAASTTTTPATTTPATTTGPDVTPAPSPPADVAPAPAYVPAAPAPAQTTAPSTSNNQSAYGGLPARSFNQQPVTRSHASH
ncbi:MAG: hypothetical protein QOD01_2689 [Actinomycetota bacterium]|nr:hypothetical protein [Actinomycetota bacterium]